MARSMTLQQLSEQLNTAVNELARLQRVVQAMYEAQTAAPDQLMTRAEFEREQAVAAEQKEHQKLLDQAVVTVANTEQDTSGSKAATSEKSSSSTKESTTKSS